MPLGSGFWRADDQQRRRTSRCAGDGAAKLVTVAFTLDGVASDDVARALAKRAVFVSNGDFNATTVIERLGHAVDGVVRAGCACYTTADEVDRLIAGVAEIARD